MKKNSEYFRFLLFGFCAFIITYFSHLILPSKIPLGINDLSSWYVYSFSKKSIKPFKFIAIAVDEHSLNEMHQRWPWKRSVYARLINLLDKERVNTIGIDFVFVGESENKDDDAILKEALSAASCRIVLSYFFDFEKTAPVFPLQQLKEPVYAVGMLNTPIDSDGKIRRLRAYIKTEEASHYSFSVEMASAFLRQKPQDIVSFLPLARDRTFFINYLLKPQDIITVSFYDALANLEGLKKRYGNDFLKDSLVLLYPEAEILHDTYNTPLGKAPGGLLHLNGVADIASGRLIRNTNILFIPFLIFSFVAIFWILRYYGFIIGILFTLGILILDFWGLVLFSLGGIKFDYSYIVIFSSAFFIIGSLYKYIYFLTQVLKIKDKATLDPLRELFTLRYFYYRLNLEMDKFYLGKDLFLLFVYLESFKEATDELALEKIKEIWRGISSHVSLRGKLWSVYSQDELAGCIVSSRRNINAAANSLRNNLTAQLLNADIKTKIKLAYVKLKKNYPIRDLLSFLSGELKKSNEEIVLFEDSDLVHLSDTSTSKAVTVNRLLDSFDEDIEFRNKQLLSLIENLNREHTKTKEAFFQIITSLVNALEARDSYTQGHSERVSKYSLMMAEKLGWPAEEKEKLRKASLLHDLGKIGIPDNILHKKGSLDEAEYNFIKQHEIIGVRILEPLKEMNEILPWILYHHERWDGKGYPHGLAGAAIPEAAQIISLADVFDAITTGRDYKQAFSPEEAVKEIIRNKGTQFNPRLADLFIEVIPPSLPK